MKLIRRLAKKLSTLKQFVGFVMAEVVLDRGVDGSTLKVLSSKKNLAVIETADAGLRLTVKLLKADGGASEKNFASAPRGTFWKKFSASEVEEFIRDVDDDNEIHRGARPIVPGFLIVEALLNDRRLIERKKIRLRFKQFTTVDENLYLTFDGGQFYVDADERKIDGWILDN